ncbi:MAG: tRNA (N(6)-L-threonylcarbamoyladenosine(37)-C(2))-methylthiotransferase [Candidatus Altiarchaeales archaeon]|nr:tRNA (N(6)-L-threonylcarbamoyladenosine(37)-C(2))-methylthiotransferase [Candidatus Altiarchaeales archaeon]MBD3417183.1 tRNA (N(6)-L-threonylcarbamoyladenosine(37)-C(2))-methylthiotransferase [Candidatus Altiarchaeales archaeon]
MRVLTYGCATNQADSEIIRGVLREHGLDREEVVVVNTCTVKSPTENKILKKMRKLGADGEKVVVAGCMPPARPGIVDEFPTFSFIGVNTHDIVEAVSATAKGERYVNIRGSENKSCMPRVRANEAVGILPIGEGCLGSCSYCQTKFARGNLRSYPLDKLAGEVERMVGEGVREVWMTSQDTGAYGRDIGSGLPELLKSICGVDGDFKVRVGMMNPDHALKMLEDLVGAFDDDKMYRFLHIPVQSGSDKVLEDMNRRYTVEDFHSIVDRVGDFTLSTDVIVGYPTEGESEFQETVSLIEDVKPDVLNVSRYWPRPGTRAARLKGHPGSETKRRSRIMDEVFQRVGLEKNKKWIGWRGPALVSEANPDGTVTARNQHYKPIVAKGGRLGESIDVEVRDCTYYDLRGSLL